MKLRINGTEYEGPVRLSRRGHLRMFMDASGRIIKPADILAALNSLDTTSPATEIARLKADNNFLRGQLDDLRVEKNIIESEADDSDYKLRHVDSELSRLKEIEEAAKLVIDDACRDWNPDHAVDCHYVKTVFIENLRTALTSYFKEAENGKAGVV